MVSLVLFLELQHLQLGWPYEHAWYSVWNDVLESAFGPHFTIHPQAPINGKYPDFAVWHYPKGKPVLALLVEVKRGGTRIVRHDTLDCGPLRGVEPPRREIDERSYAFPLIHCRLNVESMR